MGNYTRILMLYLSHRLSLQFLMELKDFLCAFLSRHVTLIKMQMQCNNAFDTVNEDTHKRKEKAQHSCFNFSRFRGGGGGRE